MKLLVLSLLVAAAYGGPSYSRVFSEQNQAGSYVDVLDYVTDLSTYNFDNAIDSVIQTGMWMYYENYDFNLGAGLVYWVHGIDISVSFPFEYSDISSSMRYAGTPSTYLNDDTFTVYEGTAFTGREFYSTGDTSSFGDVGGTVSSVIITGLSPWTIYSAEGWMGDVLCVYPNTDHDVGPNGEVFDLGLFPDMSSLNVPDNSIWSVRKGCWSEKVVYGQQLKTEGRTENGAWGYIRI